MLFAKHNGQSGAEYKNVRCKDGSAEYSALGYSVSGRTIQGKSREVTKKAQAEIYREKSIYASFR